ncbi:TCR/Tet family MFS transporter [Shimia biformata]|uniref:TCR/Tet family MFS transporter n=1 Tax=Shimia biformata TaxID=1294299 RepID=UPI001951E1CE|nr:TCR/Tet family MFS transporter [Shimia biformata]
MSKQLQITFILTTVVIDAMGIGLILPVMPDLIRDIGGGDIADAAVWGGILATAFAVMQFLFGPIIGNLSDRYGRRPVLLVSLFVMALDYVVMAVAGAMWLLLLGRIVGGITAATHSTASAFIADVSAPEEKDRNFGLIGAAFGIGFVLGPIVGGLLAEFGTRAPFWAAACLSFANVIFGALVLRETVTDAIRRPFSWKRANPLGAFRAVGRLPELKLLLVVFFLYQVAGAVYPAIWPYFTTERFGWSPGMIGLSLALYGAGFALVQGLLVSPSVRRFGDRATVTIGLTIETATMIFLAFVWTTAALFASIPVAALGAIGLPALQAILSRRVPDDAQGELQGVLASLMSLATIVAPIAMTQTFAYFTRPEAPFYLPGAPFLLSTVLMLGTLALFAKSRRRG